MHTSIYQHIAAAEGEKSPIWMATVITVEGSTPVKIGMKMIVRQDGTIAGTIGGGEIERRVIARIVDQKPPLPAKWRYDLGLQHDEAEKTGMICGGYQEVFIEPLFQGAPLYILGGGHCGMALSEMAAKCGFLVTVIDDRPEWASMEKHPHANRCICTPFAQVADHIGFSPQTFIVIMTYGHKHDELVLRQCIGKESKYLGMIGSEKKALGVLERLSRDSIAPEQLKRVFTPIGFPIGSNTPEEIAVSILAQMIAVKNERPASQFGTNPLR